MPQDALTGRPFQDRRREIVVAAAIDAHGSMRREAEHLGDLAGVDQIVRIDEHGNTVVDGVQPSLYVEPSQQQVAPAQWRLPGAVDEAPRRLRHERSYDPVWRTP
jgi:hypothetical protein